MTVALTEVMTRTGRPGAPITTRCPHCALADVPAWPIERGGLIAWFTCPSCGHDWSARIRNGRAVADTVFEIQAPHASRA